MKYKDAWDEDYKICWKNIRFYQDKVAKKEFDLNYQKQLSYWQGRLDALLVINQKINS